MNLLHSAFTLRLIAALTACGFAVAHGAEKTNTPPPKDSRSDAEIEAATRLQVFLDRANFGPGKIDGYYGDFTRKALALYRKSRGEKTAPAPKDKEALPDVSGLDLASVDPVFITYTVTDADLQSIGDLPDEVPEKAKLKMLPYRDAAEAIAEKFHCDRDFLEKLNPGKTAAIKAGDQLKVPSVEPFEASGVKELKPGSEITPAAANDIGDNDEAGARGDATKATNTSPAAETAAIAVRVDTETNMLSIYDADQLVAAFPVTIGSGQTESPVGDWKVKGVAMMPTFRHDEKMLKEGVRSDDFHMLAPGPNNPVGVVWIALNKPGIGLHGTDDPDSIGRSVSHGCVRLANWDIVRVAMRLKGGVPVTIE